MKALSIIVWSKLEISNTLVKYTKIIRLLRVIYALVIVFSCVVTFITLVIFPPSNARAAFDEFIKIASLLTFFVFIIDWIGHLLTYRYVNNLQNTSVWKVFTKYFFSFSSIVIILCTLSSAQAIKYFLNDIDQNSEYVFTTFQSLGLVRIIRLFMVLSLLKPFAAITGVFINQRKLLTSVFFIIVVLIILFALIIWSQETVDLFIKRIEFLSTISEKYSDNSAFAPFVALNALPPNSAAYQEMLNKITQEQFETAMQLLTADDMGSLAAVGDGYIKNFGEAFYFTTITLTTVGYGDFSPHADISRVIVSFIALLAIAIVAIPSGIIAGAFLTEMQTHTSKKKKQQTTNAQQETKPTAEQNQ